MTRLDHVTFLNTMDFLFDCPTYYIAIIYTRKVEKHKLSTSPLILSSGEFSTSSNSKAQALDKDLFWLVLAAIRPQICKICKVSR